MSIFLLFGRNKIAHFFQLIKMSLFILLEVYIRKSGKHTAHVGKYWSGCSQRMEKGLEAGVFSVVDIDNHTAFHRTGDPA